MRATWVMTKAERRWCWLRSAPEFPPLLRARLGSRPERRSAGIQRGGEADRHGNRHADAQDQPVHVNVGAPGKRLDEEQAHHGKHAGGEQHRAGGAQEREQHPLGKHLADQARTAGADGGAHGHFAFALDAAREQQAGDVNAADGEHGQDRAQQRPQRAAALAYHALGQRLQVNGAAPIGIGIGAAYVGEDVLQVGLRLFEGDAVLDAGHGAHPVAAAVLHPRLIDQARRVDHVAHAERIAKTRGHDADDGVGDAVHFHRPAEDAAIAAEVGLPDFVAEDDELVLSILLLARQIGAAQQRLHAEYLEEIVGGVHRVEQNGAAIGCIDGGAEEVVVSRQGGKSASLRALVAIAGPGGGLGVTALADGHDTDDAVRLRIGKGAQDHGVDDAEHRGGHAHAQGQRESDSECKSRRRLQLPQRIAQILKQHPGLQSLVP